MEHFIILNIKKYSFHKIYLHIFREAIVRNSFVGLSKIAS